MNTDVDTPSITSVTTSDYFLSPKLLTNKEMTVNHDIPDNQEEVKNTERPWTTQNKWIQMILYTLHYQCDYKRLVSEPKITHEQGDDREPWHCR